MTNFGRLSFGAVYIAHHSPSTSASLQLQRELEIAEHIDALGYDEMWFGEHHSGGWEIVAAPEVMIAAAAQRTKHLRFGTGMASVPYHNPFLLLERMLMLDNLTRGRLILGVGPGSLAKDARMIGLDPLELRHMLEESMDTMFELLKYEGPVNRKNDWFTLNNAQLQWAPYNETLPMAVAQAMSPSGPRMAGKYGTGMLSVAAASPGGFAALQDAWALASERAEEFGQQISRKNWGIAYFMHIADTEKEARRQVKYGLKEWVRYMNVASFFRIDASLSEDETIDYLNESGTAVIGTPDTLIQKIEELQKQTGGFGTLHAFGHEWANHTDTKRSLEIIAERVMPRFQNHVAARNNAFAESVREAQQGLGVAEWEAAGAKARAEHEAEQQAKKREQRG
jgi:limonene 1,2-monooxygenase